MGGECSTNRRGAKLYKILVGKPEGKVLAGTHRRRWEGNVKELIWECIPLAENRDQPGSSCEHDHELPGSMNGGEFLD